MKGTTLKNYGTVTALVVIIGIFGLLRPASFFTLKNFLNITRQAAPLAIIALGATFVMTVNEFDLSIGNIVSLGAFIDSGRSNPCLLSGSDPCRTGSRLRERSDRSTVRNPLFHHNTGHGNRAGRCNLRTYRWNDRI